MSGSPGLWGAIELDAHFNGAIHRALKVMELLAYAEEETLGITELCRGVGIPKSTAHRILSLLAATGYVKRGHKTKQYQLSLKLVELAGAVQRKSRICRLAAPHLSQLMRQTRETVSLCAVERLDVIVIDSVPSLERFIAWSILGQARPLHCTAAGKVVLASLPKGELEKAAPEGQWQPYTKKTITSHALLMEYLPRVRQRGYAVEDEEYELGVRGVAAPGSGWKWGGCGRGGGRGPYGQD